MEFWVSKLGLGLGFGGSAPEDRHPSSVGLILRNEFARRWNHPVLEQWPLHGHRDLTIMGLFFPCRSLRPSLRSTTLDTPISNLVHSCTHIRPIELWIRH